MALKDPVAAHNSGTNVEAIMVCNMLIDAGIEAYSSEDNSPAGMWLMGFLPEIHRPQVWIERKDMERAAPLLAEYEQRLAHRKRAEEAQKNAQGTVQVQCEECGETTTFVAGLRGTIQNCPKCNSFVDVGEVASDDIDYGEPEAEPGE